MLKPDVILVDGSSYLFRAFFALPPLNTSNGQPTGAIFGVINMLRKLRKQFNPEYFAVVFDAKGKNFRHELYDKYKANRPPMADELRSQIEPLHNTIKAMGLPLIIEEGVEADDVIGTLAFKAAQQGKKVLISTSDKDMAQLVNDDIQLINTMSDTTFDAKKVEEKFGVPPKLIIDYLALIGDSSDNIPGVNKVGPKTAVKWLTQYGSLKEIINHAAEFKGKAGENLRAHLEFLPLGIDLVTIRHNMQLLEHLNELKPQAEDIDKLRELFSELEFKSWLAMLEHNHDSKNEPAPSTDGNKTDYKIIQNTYDWKKYYDKLANSTVFALDTETTALDAMQAKLVGVSFALEANHAVYIPLQHDPEIVSSQLPLDLFLKDLQTLLNDSSKTIIAQNIKYDIKVLARNGIKIKSNLFDTMLAAYVLNPQSSRLDLETLAQQNLGISVSSFKDVAGSGKKQLTFDKIALDKAAPYAAEDADVAFQLYTVFNKQLESDKVKLQDFTEIEIPLLKTLTNIEMNGVKIDSAELTAYSKKLGAELSKLTNKITTASGSEFNIDSPKQLQEVLYQKMKLPVLKKTPTGQPATNEAVLQELALDHPIAKNILKYRSLNKLKSTYADKLPEQVNPETGRVHPAYKQTGTITGRLSCRDPNLQNIPIRTEAGREIRKSFIAGRGRKIVSADYSQVELRLMAHLSQDETMLAAFANNHDIHRATAAEIMGIDYEKVSDAQRRSAKAVNFGLLYGMSAFGLAKQLGIERKSAQEYIDNYFARYPKVKQYLQGVREAANKNGYVETIFDRKLPISNINSKNAMLRKAAERAAINAPLQGSAADIIKRAMLTIDKKLQSSKLDAKMIMQVHDELVFDVANNDVDELCKIVKTAMEKAAKISVSLDVSISSGTNWDEAH